MGQIMAGSAYVDRALNQIGDPAEHAMRNAGDTVAQAQARTCAFIRRHMADYRRHLGIGNTYAAYYSLGQALHPVMDSTSPEHRLWQVWHSPRRQVTGGQWVGHGNAHGSNEGMDSLTIDLLNETMALIQRTMYSDDCACTR